MTISLSHGNASTSELTNLRYPTLLASMVCRSVSLSLRAEEWCIWADAGFVPPSLPPTSTPTGMQKYLSFHSQSGGYADVPEI